MPSNSTTRRRYLLTAGAALTTTVAGCQTSSSEDGTTSTTAGETTTTTTDTTTTTTTADGSGGGPTDDDDLPPDTNPDDGLPPEFENPPEAMQFDPESFPTVTRQPTEGSTVQVPLVPLDVAYNLYARREARFLDTRVEAGYDVSHVFGATRSPPPDGAEDDPTGTWDVSTPVVTYCHCPTYLATQRAAYMLDNGFDEVYALQNGYQAWKVANYPTDGEGVPSTAASWTVEGETDADDAGGVAYVSHDPTQQVAGAEIAADGTYSVTFSFASASGSDDATVGTPSYEVSGSLETMAKSTVTADSGASGNGTATNGTDNGTSENGSEDDGLFDLLAGR
ncbi:MAG: rhodanese-like domain-containing protein [Halobacteriaceae archaeon]